MSESSFGNAAPKSRSINIGANLLGEWIEEQARTRRDLARSFALLGLTVATVGIALPTLLRGAGEAGAKAAAMKGRVTKLDEALAVSDKARKEAQPTLAVEGMRGRTQASFDRLLDELDGALRAGNARTVLSSVHADVQAGEIHLIVLAEAEEDGAADAFARNAEEAGASVDAITNSRPSRLLGPQGLSFQYEKRTKVSP